MKRSLCVLLLASGAVPSLWSQHKQFIQAELMKTIKAKTAKEGDPVRARTAKAVVVGGVNVPEGTILLGQIRAVTTTSLAISFDRAQLSGKERPLSLSIRAAMMPGDATPSSGLTGETGTVIGIPGVTLSVDESPQHASKFETAGKDLQLKQGLQLMLAQP